MKINVSYSVAYISQNIYLR